MAPLAPARRGPSVVAPACPGPIWFWPSPVSPASSGAGPVWLSMASASGARMSRRPCIGLGVCS
eukprot:7783689-Lingulodinium_polyedra.AAC.1